MAGLLPNYILREWNNDGRLLSGGKVYFYESGTLTPKPTYTTYLLNVQHTNPVILDAGGAADIWLGDGAYRVLITDANGVQIRSPIDGIVGVGAGTIDASSNATMAVLKVYNDLRALTSIPDVVYLTGREEEGDGGAGLFQLQPGSTDTDDDGVILVTTTGSRVYKRIFDGVIDPRWYGVAYGPSVDQALAFQAACAGSVRHSSPLDFKGVVFLGQNVAVPALAHLKFSAGAYLVAGAEVTVTFAATSGLDGDGVIFGSNVKPIFGRSVCDAIRLSWMGGDDDTVRWSKVLTCSTEKYSVLMDVSTTIDSNLTVAANFSVKPVGGAILTVDGPADLDMNLDHGVPVQCFAFTQSAYIQSIALSTPVVYMEWFGGSALNSGNDNATPFKACCAAKRLDLQAGPLNYTVTSSNTFTISDFVTWVGNGSKITLNQAITVLGIYLNDITIFGSGSITHSSCVATKTTSIVPLLVGPTSSINSNLISVALIVKSENSTITNPVSIQGSIQDTTLGSSTSIQAVGPVWMNGGEIQSTSTAPVFVFSNDVLESSFKGVRISASSTFFYSANSSLVVKIQACENDDWNNGKAVHNGIATVYLSGCGVKNNPSVTSIDGIDIQTDGMIKIEASPAPVTISATTTPWKAPVSLTSDGEYITLGGSVSLSSDPFSISTVRAIAKSSFDGVWRYGGVLEVYIDYPNGAPPDPSVEIGVMFCHPPTANVATVGVNALGDGGYFCAEPWTLGEAVPARLPAISTGAKLKATVPVWGGQIDIRAVPETHSPYTVSDIWGDSTTTVPDNTNSLIQEYGRLVIYSKSGGVALPSGTKIKAVCRYDLPSEQQYKRFFPDHKPFQHIGSNYYKADATTWQAVRIRTSLTGSYLGQTQLAVPFLFRGGDYNGVQGSLSRRSADNFTPVQWNGSTLTVGWS